MGWFYTNGSTKKSIIAERISFHSTKNHAIKEGDAYYFEFNCLKHCYRGNNFSGILWTVWKITQKKISDDTQLSIRSYIGCDKLEYSRHDGGAWGYKPMDESMGPCYYSCPLGYLKMVPCVDKDWRMRVLDYHAHRNSYVKEDVLSC